MRKIALVVGFTAMLVSIAAGCAPKLFLNDVYVNKLRRGKDKLLIMPVVFHRFPSKITTDLETSTFVRFFALFGKYGYSVQPLRDSFDAAGFANLPWQLPQGMYHVASVHKSSNMSKFQYPAWLGTMLASARKFANWAPYALRLGGVKIPADYKFRYILTAMVSKIGTASGGGKIRYRVIGGIVDVKRQQVVCATWFERSSKNDKASIATDLQDLGEKMKAALKPIFVKLKPVLKK